MKETAGTVISVHRLGATVRLADGTLASVPLSEISAHAEEFDASLNRREPVALVLEGSGRHRAAFLARSATSSQQAVPAVAPGQDAAFEERMRRYLKSTEEWAPPDRPDPADRHFIRKKRRAAHFEARNKGA